MLQNSKLSDLIDRERQHGFKPQAFDTAAPSFLRRRKIEGGGGHGAARECDAKRHTSVKVGVGRFDAVRRRTDGRTTP